jgi:hypothetical protein
LNSIECTECTELSRKHNGRNRFKHILVVA